MTAQPPSFDAFYVNYLAQHRHPANRALHLFAKFAMAALIVVAVVDRSWLALVGVPFVGVLPCWLGHLLVEHNRPTSWTRPAASLLGALRAKLAFRRATDSGRPYWSFLADLRMCSSMLGFGSQPAPEVAADDASDRT